LYMHHLVYHSLLAATHDTGWKSTELTFNQYRAGSYLNYETKHMCIKLVIKNWRIFSVERAIVAQLIQKFSTIYGTRIITVVFKTLLSSLLNRLNPVHNPVDCYVHASFNNVLLHKSGFHNWSFSPVFPGNIFVHFSTYPVCSTCRQSHAALYDRTYTWLRLLTTK
jgi:hypothetical protein